MSLRSSPTITEVTGRRVWDSRGRPTVEAEVRCGAVVGRAIAPAGASTGSAEAVERRDGGARLGGHDVTAAVASVSGPIAAALVGRDVDDQRALDATIEALDPDPTLASIGANAAVAASLACAHASAAVRGVPLWTKLADDDTDHTDNVPSTIPLPEIQIFGGGAHAGRRIDIQDLMVMAPAAASAAEALEWTAEIYLAAGASRPRPAGVADEGGWWPDFDTNEAAIAALADAVVAAGFRLGRDVVLSLDVAASELWDDHGGYRLGLEGRRISSGEMAAMVARWCRDYSILSVEDPLGEHDPAGMEAFTAAAGPVQVVGDDLFVTDAGRVARFADAATAMLLKVNQAGTVSRSRAALGAARAGGLGAIASARSGESEDTSVVHLAVGWGVEQLKVGSMARGERTAKWNELLRIEDGNRATMGFSGWRPLRRGTAPTTVGAGVTGIDRPAPHGEWS
jgi:enolase 1/2/3